MTTPLGRRLALAIAVALGVAAGAAVAQPPAAPGPAPAAQSRVALIIGNGAYESGPLNNPKNDARGMSEALRALGFDVVVRENAKNLDMRRAVVEFGEKLTAGGVGLFYYSGHGMQVGGKNYLLPVDADLKSERYVSVESLDVDSVLAQMDAAKSAVNIVILDACRDNPFARRFRSASRGLAFMDAPTGTYIAYATSPGNVAEDGTPGQYGVYTGELLKAMKEPGLPIEEVFKRVRQSVVSKTNGRQSPWDASSLTGAFYFQRGAPAEAPRDTVAAVPPAAPRAPTVREEIVQEAGSLALRAKLEGVEVVVRDRVVGETRSGRAIVVDNLAVGVHRVKARKQGYKDWERDVTIAANQRVELVIDIEPLRAETPRPLKVILDDDFTARPPWPPGRSEFCEKRHTPDGYVVTNIRETGGCSVLRGGFRHSGPARIELSFKRLKGRLDMGVSLLFGASEELGYLLTVSGAPSKGMSVTLEEPKKKERRMLLPWRRDSNVNEGLNASNVIAVEIRDKTLRCYVNGAFITTVTTPEPPVGRVGVALSAGVEAVFTRLVVSELGPE